MKTIISANRSILVYIIWEICIWLEVNRLGHILGAILDFSVQILTLHLVVEIWK